MENQSDAINELATALAKAQASIKPASKNAENPFFKSSYADLASVWEACRKPLADNGLAVTQTTEETDKGTLLRTTLVHSSGQWIAGNLKVTAAKQDAQSVGSAITYARRYALSAIVGIAPEGDDDDGNTAAGKKAETEKPKQAQPAPKPEEKQPTVQHVNPAGLYAKLSADIEAAKAPGDVRQVEFYATKATKEKTLTLDQQTALKDAIQAKKTALGVK